MLSMNKLIALICNKRSSQFVTFIAAYHVLDDSRQSSRNHRYHSNHWWSPSPSTYRYPAAAVAYRKPMRWALMQNNNNSLNINDLVKQCQPFIVTVCQTSQLDSWIITGQSTGVIVDNIQGLIVTNNHCVMGSDIMRIYFHQPPDSQLTYDQVFVDHPKHDVIKDIVGHVVYTEPYRDLALIQLPPVRPGVLVQALFDTNCESGDPILTIATYTDRVEAVDGLIVDPQVPEICQQFFMYSTGVTQNDSVCQHTGFCRGGYSGSPMVNANGHVVAIHNVGTPNSSCSGTGLNAKAVLDFIAKGKQFMATNRQLANTEREQSYSNRYHKKLLGLILEGNVIREYSMASQEVRNNLSIGDTIQAINGNPCTTFVAFVDQLQAVPDNQTVTLTVLRNGLDPPIEVQVTPVVINRFTL
ncbi:uncharacterized protein LOC128959941 [Oppia nitens]|uniref:uncharacterized protein LOC128959941 n=1 Tax=Oppia nitens TaxID=1686743 RepID=UPI0023DB4F5C|nr:uncharacterized protein LOC128959941 [Oppia nitens]